MLSLAAHKLSAELTLCALFLPAHVPAWLRSAGAAAAAQQESIADSSVTGRLQLACANPAVVAAPAAVSSLQAGCCLGWLLRPSPVLHRVQVVPKPAHTAEGLKHAVGSCAETRATGLQARPGGACSCLRPDSQPQLTSQQSLHSSCPLCCGNCHSPMQARRSSTCPCLRPDGSIHITLPLSHPAAELQAALTPVLNLQAQETPAPAPGCGQTARPRPHRDPCKPKLPSGPCQPLSLRCRPGNLAPAPGGSPMTDLTSHSTLFTADRALGCPDAHS